MTDGSKRPMSNRVKELNLTVGQQKLLSKGINAAKCSVPTNKKEEKVNAKEITTASLSKDKDLEAILNKLESTGGLEALLTDAPLSTEDAKKAEISGGSHELRVDSDPHVYLNRSKGLPKGSSKAKKKEKRKLKGTSKPLLIPDFVDYGGDPYDEQEIVSSNSTSVLVRTLKGKPKLESIAISTWIAANAKIMDRLITLDRLKTNDDILDHLSYTVKIGELIETFTWVSVLQYDNEYRKRQFEYGFRWGSDSQHLHSRFLKQRGLAASQNRGYQAGARTNTNRRNSTKTGEICNQFNSSSGCSWPDCRFQHKCNIAGCSLTPVHPQHEHAKLLAKLNGHN